MIRSTTYDSTTNTHKPTESYQGRVFSTFVKDNYQIMSDVYGWARFAIVWDDVSASPKTVLVDVWEYKPGEDHSVDVDATEEAYRNLANYIYRQEVLSDIERQKKVNGEITKGCIVTVNRGRNHKGVTGPVVVIIEGTYGFGRMAKTEKKVGIATSERKVQVEKYGKVYENYADVVWVWMRNVDAANPAPVDVPAIKAAAFERVKTRIEYLKTEHSWPNQAMW